jgi:hypothetical protein
MGEPAIEATEFAKSKKLYEQPEFHIVQDHSADPYSEVPTIPEFVIHPAEESQGPDAFLGNVRAAQAYIRKAPRGIAVLSDGAFAGNSKVPLTDQRQGGAQATFGIRPEGVADLFKAKATRVPELTNLHEHEIVTRAVAAAGELTMLLPQGIDRAKAEGFLALICQYCVSNSIFSLQQGRALDKNKVPFLVRSTMGEIAAATLDKPTREYFKENSGELAARILKVTGANGANPIISPTRSERKPVYNVPAAVWVKTALEGNDEPLKWGSMQAGEDSKLIPPERVGSAPSPGSGSAAAPAAVPADAPPGAPADERAYGAVVEERNLVAGQVQVAQWDEIAGRQWELVRRANGIDE